MSAPTFGCGDSTCLARVRVFLYDPTDLLVVEPCPRCVDALADSLGVARADEEYARTMRAIHAEIVGCL